ncbi:hypothetical protein Tco_0896916 [Tanacetum coccineum]
MITVIKEEFKKLESLKISDDSFACNASLEIFHKEFNRMSRMDNNLFTYKVKIPGHVSVPCDLNDEDDLEQQMTHESNVNIEYDPSNARGDDEVELTDEESSNSNDEDEVAEFFRIDTNKDDGYCNCGNFPGEYVFGNTLRYQDLEWYKALEDGKLKDEALKNKAIMEGMIDDDDESHNEGWRRWDGYENTIHNHEERENEEEHENKERCELFDDTTQKRPVCNIRRFEMIKYLFGKDKEFVAKIEHEYDDLTNTNEDACRTY